MSKDVILVPALDSFKEYTLGVDREWYNRVKGDFNKACEDNPEQVAKLYEYFLEADRSDLLNPKHWHQRNYGKKSDSRQFESIIGKFERSDRLIAKHYVENRPTEEVKRVMAREAAPEIQ